MRCSHASCLCEVDEDEPGLMRAGKPVCSEHCRDAAPRPADEVEACRCGHPECSGQERAEPDPLGSPPPPTPSDG